MTTEQINKIIIDYMMPYDPIRIGLFGSFARNEQTAESDVDILINIKKSISLFDLAGIYSDLEELLGRKVDIITERSIRNQRFKKRMEEDLKIIYENS